MLSLLMLGLVLSQDAPHPEGNISKVLDTFHDAAAKADEKRYFDCMAADFVFLGTDATERWTKEEFRKFCKPYFDKGTGWLYLKKERHVTVGADGKTAWFDELLENKKNGLCRGSGVLVKESGGWKLTQYNLSIPIPNDVFPKVKPLIEAGKK